MNKNKTNHAAKADKPLKPCFHIWERLHRLSRQELLFQCGFTGTLEARPWDELEAWVQNDLRDLLLRKSNGQVSLKGEEKEGVL